MKGLKKELLHAQKSRKVASASLRMALQKAAQLRLMEKEKNKSPSYAMCISLQFNKVVWSMIVDGKSFAEAEINDMVSLCICISCFVIHHHSLECEMMRVYLMSSLFRICPQSTFSSFRT